MSPEINGNPPSVTKRKKNREKKSAAEVMHNFDLNMPSCNYFPVNSHPYSTFNMPEMPNTYMYMACPNRSEPMSLPIYPMNYPGYTCPSGVLGSIGNISRQSTLSNHTFNIASDMPDYLSLPVENADLKEESKRRFSDPGLPNDSDSGSNSYDEGVVGKLMQQVRLLKESNHRLSRELMELRIEVNLIKQQQASRHFEREYEPGMLADVIREVREAARVREDALLARVKHFMEEKHLSANQFTLATEKSRNNDRISKLEEQLKSLKVSGNSRSDDSISALNSSLLSIADDKESSARHISELEREALELRRELEDTKAKKEEAELKVHGLSSLLQIKSDADSVPTTVVPPRVILTGPVTSV